MNLYKFHKKPETIQGHDNPKIKLRMELLELLTSPASNAVDEVHQFFIKHQNNKDLPQIILDGMSTIGLLWQYLFEYFPPKLYNSPIIQQYIKTQSKREGLDYDKLKSRMDASIRSRYG